LGGLGSGYIVWWDEPRPLDQTDLKRRSRCDVEMCCNVLREGQNGWPLGQAGWLEGGAGGLLWSPLSPHLSSILSHVFWSLLVSGSDPFDMN
jgi:hypothetical protein